MTKQQKPQNAPAQIQMMNGKRLSLKRESVETVGASASGQVGSPLSAPLESGGTSPVVHSPASKRPRSNRDGASGSSSGLSSIFDLRGYREEFFFPLKPKLLSRILTFSPSRRL